MRKAYNLYKDGSIFSGKTELSDFDGAKKIDTGTWEIYNCLDFDGKNWFVEFPSEDNQLTIESEFENNTLTVMIKKYGELYDCRGFTLAVNYHDIEEGEKL